MSDRYIMLRQEDDPTLLPASGQPLNAAEVQRTADRYIMNTVAAGGEAPTVLIYDLAGTHGLPLKVSAHNLALLDDAEGLANAFASLGEDL